MSSHARALRVGVVSGGEVVPVCPWGGTRPFKNDYFEGQLFFVHRPPKDSSVEFAHESYLNPEWKWEVMIQGRFKVLPQGPLWLHAELRDGPMKLGLVSRGLCRVLLKFVQHQTQKRGIEFRYSFGDQAGERPCISVPLLALDRIYISDRSTTLPCGSGEAQGTWRLRDDRWIPVERSSVVIDTSTYFAFAMASGYLDWAAWAVVNVPGLGALDLEGFWGPQGCWATIADEPGGIRRTFCEMSLAAPRTKRWGDAEVRAEKIGSKTSKGCSSGEEVVDAEALEAEPTMDDQDKDEEDTDDVVEASEFNRAVSAYVEESDSAKSSSVRDISVDVPGEKVSEVEQLIECPDVTGIRTRLSALQEVSVSEEGDSNVTPPQQSAPNAVVLPWYLLTSRGDLWWCLDFQGRLSWRKHEQLQELCQAVDPQSKLSASHSVQELERTRRAAQMLLVQSLEQTPELLDEFTHVQVDLPSLLSWPRSTTKAGVSKAWVGVIEAEGRIVERYLRISDASLYWRVSDPFPSVPSNVPVPSVQRSEWADRRIRPAVDFVDNHVMPALMQVSVDLLDASTDLGSVAGAPALTLKTQCRKLVFAFQNEEVMRRWAAALQGHRCAASAPTDTPTTDFRWREALRRWPKNRVVLNDSELCLEDPGEPLALSASLLREAVAAQAAGRLEAQRLTSRSCALKRVDLSSLGPQELWSFWVNIFHCLVVHAFIVWGRPAGLRQVHGFYSNVSYLVAGHVFSLVELEHIVLRHHMTKPKVRLLKFLIRVWRRSDADYEQRPCLAAPRCPASAFKPRPDWRLNLVLNMGNRSSAEVIPVFEAGSESAFNERMRQAIERALASSGGPQEHRNMRVLALPERALNGFKHVSELRGHLTGKAYDLMSSLPQLPQPAWPPLPQPAWPSVTMERARYYMGRETPGDSAPSTRTPTQATPRSRSDSPQPTAPEKTMSPVVELPYQLYRFRDDAPPGAPGEGHERRWARALVEFLPHDTTNIQYSRNYKWAMRDRFVLLD